MLLYGFLEITKTVIGVAKITVHFSFCCLASHFSREFEVYFKVFYGVPEIFKVDICVANITIAFFFLSLLSNFIVDLVVFPRLQFVSFCLFSAIPITKLQIKSTSFPEDVVVVTIFLAFQLF